MVDINNDELLDIYVCNAGYVEGRDQENELFINNGDLTFTEKAADYNLNENGYTSHAAFFDYDLDGDKETNTMSSDDFQIGISPGNLVDTSPSKAYWFPNSIEGDAFEQVQYAVQKKTDGYTIELALPWALYPSFNPQSGQTLRINIDPSDTDNNAYIQETLLSTSPHRKLGNPRTLRTLKLL